MKEKTNQQPTQQERHSAPSKIIATKQLRLSAFSDKSERKVAITVDPELLKKYRREIQEWRNTRHTLADLVGPLSKFVLDKPNPGVHTWYDHSKAEGRLKRDTEEV